MDELIKLVSSDPKNIANGTGFVVAHDEKAKRTFLVTCAHVVVDIQERDPEKRVHVNQEGVFAEVVTMRNNNFLK